MRQRRSAPGRAWSVVLVAAVLAGCGFPATGVQPTTPGAAGPSFDTSGTIPSPAPASPTARPLPPARPASASRLPGEPDPALTPGAINPAVRQATIGATICVAGWTATVRPPVAYTNTLKVEQIAQYGYRDPRTASYEEDHLIPLELGGAPRDPRNLWPEPYAASLADGRATGARVKDAFETALKRAVCAGTLTLAAARAEIGDHWVHYRYGIPLAAGVPATPRPATAASPTPTPAPRTGSLRVAFVALPDPAPLGSTATMAVTTTPGAVCSAQVTWPSGSVSSAAGLTTTPTAGADGRVAWTWNVSSRTKPGTATARVTCTLGTSGAATATFPVR